MESATLRYLSLLFFPVLFLGSAAVTQVMADQNALSWSELTAKTFSPRRSPQETDRYRSRVAEIKASGRSVESVILEEVFQMDTSMVARCLAFQCPQEFRLVISSFPYWLEPNTAHLLFYTNNDNWDEETLIEHTEKLLEAQLPGLTKEGRFDYVVRVNSVNNRTVKGLSHSHIFIRSHHGREALIDLVQGIEFSSPERIPGIWQK